MKIGASGMNMDIKANVGPSMSEAPNRNRDLDASFRILRFYDGLLDRVIARFDVIINTRQDERGLIIKGDQFNVGMESTGPGNSGLLIPNGGIVDAMAMRFDAKELANNLRALADAIDENHKERRCANLS